MFKNILAALFLGVLVSACSSGDSSGGNVARSFDPGCTSITNYTGGITLSGNAVYEFRVNGNSIVSLSPNPIRQAQVSVLNSGGTIVQCGTTDDSGNFSVVVPQTSENYTVRISSRIYDSVTKAGVFNNPTETSVHSISTSISGNATASVGTMTASATGDLKGGAFNILDKIYEANKYMAAQTASCNNTFSDCPPFTGIPAVFIFWDKGVNPGDYFGAGALSFYIPGESELYILGGVSGDTDSSDCDHFDNSIILHEYGHFIEDIFADTDSPGGTHNGDTILDARLAWGEGWANFYQAAVLNNPVYRDTSGNPLGTATVFFNENLETANNDIATTMGEGNFREFSITRLLWDSIDAANDGADNVSGTFAELWTLFAGSNGIKNSNYVFRNVGLFHTLQQNLSGGSNWSSLRAAENHRGDQNDYSRLVASGNLCPVFITAANIPGGSNENGSLSNSNQFASNDFYRYYHSGGVFTFRLDYDTADPNLPADLDVYIYKNGYRFTDTSSTSIAASATANVPVPTSSASETVSTVLAAGWYMINIRVDTRTRLGSTSEYNMTINGAQVCPN